MKPKLKAEVERYPGHPVRVTVKFELSHDTPNFRAVEFGDVIKQAVVDGEFVEGYVAHHHPVSLDDWAQDRVKFLDKFRPKDGVTTVSDTDRRS